MQIGRNVGGSPRARLDTGRIDVSVVSSATLPWRTGPSVLSICHACGLAASGYSVRYVIPWLGAWSQRKTWGHTMFESREAQTEWLRAEALRLTGLPLPPVLYYRATWLPPFRSILPLQDVYGVTPPSRALMVHEPEHLCWYLPTRTRNQIDADVTVGLIMTNYEFYVASLPIPFARALSRFVVRSHWRVLRNRTDVPVRITPAFDLPGMPANDTRITGVLAGYHAVPPVRPDTRGIYFIGKLIWEKGLDVLVETSARTRRPVDIYGSGYDEAAIRRLAERKRAPVVFHGSHDSPWAALDAYRVFFNPSKSETLCTTTADALVAGRNVVLPRCAGNLPFHDYPNTFFYEPADGPDAALAAAVRADPAPPDLARTDFDWNTACDRAAQLCRLPSVSST